MAILMRRDETMDDKQENTKATGKTTRSICIGEGLKEEHL